jgi:methanogenic corrinoid protein MtbC1
MIDTMMRERHEFLATVLRRGSNAFAGFAAAEMLDAQPEAGAGLGPDPLALWKEWLVGRIEELAAAVSAGKPELFADQVRWAASLFRARSVPVANIQESLDYLRGVLAKELPENTLAVADEYLASAVSAVDKPSPAETGQLAVDTEEGKLAGSYLVAILEGDRRKAVSTVHDAARKGWNVFDLYLRVLAPAQREIGRMWLNDEINIAEEHFATATTKMVMSQLRAREQARSPNGKTVLAAAVRDNQHDVGLQMVADVFELDGWRTISLGANVPILDLVQSAEAFQADLLLVSAALGKHLPDVRDTIRAVRQHEPTRHAKILVGGTAFAGLADLAEQYGADGYAANATEALQLGNRLVGLADRS